MALAAVLLLAGCAPPSTRDTRAPVAAPPATPAATPPATAPGRPPQFVLVSFDGAGDLDLWRYWRAVAHRDHAHMTFFLSGVYLLTAAGAGLYHPPRHAPGSSAIGFVEPAPGLGERDTIAGLLDQFAAGRAEGQELGTHYNGHFCGPQGVASWSAADWSGELDAFDGLLEGALEHNGLRRGEVADPPPASAIAGGRTPCLDGDPRVLRPVLRSHGLRYDASRIAPPGEWPEREQGVWSIPLGTVARSGTPYRNVAMDYSFYVNQSGAVDGPAAAEPVYEEQTYRSYLDAFRESYLGNRAPLSIGHHFTSWNHGAYVRALTRLLDGVCGLPEVRCVSHVELADWLDAQPPARLAALARGDFPRATAVPAPRSDPLGHHREVL